MRVLVFILLMVSAPLQAQVTMIDPPAPAGTAEPFLFSTSDGILLSWLESVAGSDRVALRFARLANDRWSAAQTIVERNDLFVNWADFPSVVQDENGRLFAHWMQKTSGATYAYDVLLAISRDGGRTWSAPVALNRDGTKAEHGFVSLAPMRGGGISAAWLDGRNMTPGKEEGDMTLRYANVSAQGIVSDEARLDARTCECCTTAMAVTSSGPVIAYRDRSSDEVRDIAVVRRTGSGWTRPQLVRADGWKIAGCPVNGPQADAIGQATVVAWFTGAENRGRVRVAFSDDGGRTFSPATNVDDGNPLGRVDVVVLDANSAVVSWLEQTSSGAEIRARLVRRSLAPKASVKIADSSTARAAGFPRIAKRGRVVYFAWTEQNASDRRIHVARAAF